MISKVKSGNNILVPKTDKVEDFTQMSIEEEMPGFCSNLSHSKDVMKVRACIVSSQNVNACAEVFSLLVCLFISLHTASHILGDSILDAGLCSKISPSYFFVPNESCWF